MSSKLTRPIAALTVVVAVAAGTSLAFAKSSRHTLKTASNAAVGKTIVVDGRGLTVYELKPETTRHLLCKKSNGCLPNWPPLTVKSRKTRLSKAAGVKGKLGLLHRNGVFQVTLGGHPLYHFAGDSSTRGMANGNGISSFGGTWHVVSAASATTKTPSATTPPTTTTMPSYPYGY